MSDAMKLDWGHSVNHLMDAARNTASNADRVDLMITDKLKALDANREDSGLKELTARRDSVNEVRSLIAAEMEKVLATLSDVPIASVLLELILKVEQLRAADPVHDKFVHQLRLASAVDELASAVAFLLGKLLVETTKEPAQ